MMTITIMITMTTMTTIFKVNDLFNYQIPFFVKKFINS